MSSATVLRLVDAMAIVIAQAYQLARSRLASAASPILRLTMQRDHAIREVELLRRELAILRAQREQLRPHRRPDYQPEQRLAILQLRRLRGWNIRRTAQRLVVHPNTIRSWIQAVEGRGNASLLKDAIVWNRLDAVRWAARELRRLCPEPELGTRTLARHLVRAGIALSRSTVQRILREPKLARPPRHPRPAMAAPMGKPSRHLLAPQHPNHVWHLDLTRISVLWLHFALTAVLDGYSRRLLQLRIYNRTPRQRDLVRLVQNVSKEYGQPRFLITDHGTQFHRQFHAAMVRAGIGHVRGRVRAPYLNGKVERVFRTLRTWWRLVLPGLTRRYLQRRFDDYRHWYNHYRPHSGLNGRTPDEAWEGVSRPKPVYFRARDIIKPQIDIRRRRCRGDPRLPVIKITVRPAA